MFRLLLTWAGSLALAMVEPRIVKDEGNFHVDIGKQVQEAVKKFDPYFQSWEEMDFIPSVRHVYKPGPNQTMSAIVADFNGDKKNDVALSGRNRTNNLLLAVVSDGDGFKVIEVDRAPLIDPRRDWIEGPKGKQPGLWTYLTHVKSGWVSSKVEGRSIQMKTDGFAEQYFEKGSVVYYLKDGKFEKFTQGD